MKKFADRIFTGFVDILNFFLDFYFLPAYCLFLASELLVFWTHYPGIALLPTLFIGTHLLFFFVFGWRKARWEGEKSEAIFQRAFWISQIICVVLTLVANWRLALIILGIQIGLIILTGILKEVAGILIADSYWPSKFEKFLHRFRSFFAIIVLIIPLVIFGITVFQSPLALGLQIAVFIVMVGLTRFIGEAEDVGVSFVELAECSWQPNR